MSFHNVGQSGSLRLPKNNLVVFGYPKVGPRRMSWLRLQGRAVAWLALFALSCQFVLSFGHVHLGKIDGGSAIWAAAVDGGDPGAVPPSPPQKSPSSVPADFCAICANIGLASTLVVPDSPTILAPSSFIHVLRWSLAASEPASFDHLLFNARGPPQA
jgi:hypothetical protein